MSMSSNCIEFDGGVNAPVQALVYRDMSPMRDRSSLPATHRGMVPLLGELSEPEAKVSRAEVEMSREEFAKRMQQERAEAAQQAEKAVRGKYEAMLQAERATVAAAISGFEAQRDEYFARAETEIVQLALAIAAKILHREAQVDPMLVATLVRLALEKLREGSRVTVRVGVGLGERWKAFFAEQAGAMQVEVLEDSGLSNQDCLLETELGVANLGLDTQLKEVEQGFFDLMALRPVKG